MNPWDNMMKVHRYKHHTVFAKVCPNGEMYFESFPNSEVDKGNETVQGGDKRGYGDGGKRQRGSWCD